MFVKYKKQKLFYTQFFFLSLLFQRSNSLSSSKNSFSFFQLLFLVQSNLQLGLLFSICFKDFPFEYPNLSAKILFLFSLQIQFLRAFLHWIRRLFFLLLHIFFYCLRNFGFFWRCIFYDSVKKLLTVCSISF